jgi:broad specificity phosphatase PhoE
MTRSAIVYLVRHGQTRLNAAGLLRGHIDTPLDEVGRREARALADMFAGLRLGAIVGSPLARAQATAATITDATDA